MRGADSDTQHTYFTFFGRHAFGWLVSEQAFVFKGVMYRCDCPISWAYFPLLFILRRVETSGSHAGFALSLVLTLAYTVACCFKTSTHANYGP